MARSGKTPILTNTQKDEAVLLYLEGMAASTAGKVVGCSHSAVLKEVKKRGFEVRSSARPKGYVTASRMPQDVLDAIVEAYLNGKSARDAAALFGKSEKVCRNELKRRGISPRTIGAARRGIVSPPKTPQDVLDAIVEAYLNGKSAKDAAALFGKSGGLCLNELKRRGIKARLQPPKDATALGKAVSLYESGADLLEVERQTGISKKILRTERARRGAKRRVATLKSRIAISAGLTGVLVEEWQGFRSTQWGLFANEKTYSEWRKKVFSRDNFTCADCGKRGGELHGHHIFRKAIFPHLALVTENGVTLCLTCHQSIRGREQLLAEQYARKIGSTVRPLIWFDSWPDRP